MEYFRMNMVEKRAVETVYPDATLITFNGGAFEPPRAHQRADGQPDARYE